MSILRAGAPYPHNTSLINLRLESDKDSDILFAATLGRFSREWFWEIALTWLTSYFKQDGCLQTDLTSEAKSSRVWGCFCVTIFDATSTTTVTIKPRIISTFAMSFFSFYSRTKVWQPRCFWHRTAREATKTKTTKSDPTSKMQPRSYVVVRSPSVAF